MSAFSVRLNYLKESRGVQQKQLADATGLVRQAIRNYELGERTPPLSALIALADYFDVSIDYLVGRTDDPTPPPPSALKDVGKDDV